MDFTQLNEQINNAITSHASEKEKALETLKGQIQAVKDWFNKFDTLTRDAKDFAVSLKPTLNKFHFASDNTGKITFIAKFSFINTYTEDTQLTNYEFVRNIDYNGCCWWIRFAGYKFTREEFLDEARVFLDEQKTLNYPTLLDNRFNFHKSNNSLNVFWNLVNLATPEQIAEMYIQSTLKIIQVFVDEVRNKNSQLADVVEKAKEELRQYNDKNKTVVTENADGSVEIQINGKTYIGTVKEA